MPTAGGFTLARTWSSAASDAAPTTASTFVTPEFFPLADSLEIRFDSVTKGADNTATVELWYKGVDDQGTEQVLPYDAAVATISGATTSVVLTGKQFTDVPAGSWYVRLGDISSSGTAAITSKAFLRYYINDT